MLKTAAFNEVVKASQVNIPTLLLISFCQNASLSEYFLRHYKLHFHVTAHFSGCFENCFEPGRTSDHEDNFSWSLLSRMN